MTLQTILALAIRHILTTFGGATIAMADDTATAAAGALVTLGGVAWSIYEKRKR